MVKKEIVFRGLLENVGKNVGKNVGINVGEKRKVILTILRRKPSISAKEIGLLMNLSSRQVERLLAGLKSDETITRQGSPKKGWWEINE